MLAIQSPPSSASFPHLITTSRSPQFRPRGNDMSATTTTKTTPQNTSVFNALGSYADRIKDANGKPIASNGTSPQPILSSLPGSTSSNMTTSTKTAPPAASSAKPPASKAEPKKEEPKAEEDGAWETVQHPRTRQKSGEDKEKKSQANASRNWRERPAKDNKEKDDEEKKRSGSKSNRKSEAGPSSTSSKSNAPSASSVKSDKALPASSGKPAWGKVTPVPPVSHTPSSTSSPHGQASSSQTPKTVSRKASQAEPSTPSVNGSNSAATTAASPALTAETASTATKVENDDEGSWRARPKDSEEQATAPPAAPVLKPTAPPPSVNAWDLRKKTLTASPAVSHKPNNDPKPGQSASSIQSGPAAPANKLSNGDVKSEDALKPAGSAPSKKKKKIAAAEGPVIVPDASAWPDVAQAAEVAKKEEEEKERLAQAQRAKEGEAGSVADDAAATAKKTKWKSIPAAELQAAVDRQAEQDRKAEASKKRLSRPAPGAATPAPPKAKAKKPSVDARKPPAQPTQVPPALPAQPPTNGETRTPSAPPNARAAPFKPAASVIRPDGESEASQATDSAVPPTTSSSTPMSRQTSAQSRGSPALAGTGLPSPALNVAVEGVANGTSSKATSGPATAPVGQSQFAQTNGTGPHNLPRVPGKRDGRGSFSHRGRGGFRGKMGGITSPVMGANGLPMDGFSRGYGYGYYPMNGMGMQYAQGQQGQAQAGQTQQAYDPTAVQWQMYQRGAAPPPPMPQTQVQGLDVQRFYVLGQVEYYFSMQNLAMDFFLRQQMDSEGWIDISMIASFNRLKSLTPDVNMVKEIMLLSSLLEVRDSKVRLAGNESKRWVLPEAKESIFPPDPASSAAASPAVESMSHEDSEISDVLETLGIPAGLGLEDMNGSSKLVPGGVEGALMKSVPPSSSASVLNGDGEVTPATSTSGREVEEEHEGEKSETVQDVEVEVR